MMRLRYLLHRRPALMLGMSLLLLLGVAWYIYRTVTPAARPASQPAGPAVSRPAPGPAAPAPAQAPTRAPTPVRGPVVSEQPAGPAEATSGPEKVTGRPDPFAPLVGGGSGSPARSSRDLPPVPPLLPGTGDLPSAGTPGAPAPVLRLAGIIAGHSVLAIVEDGRTSYIVGPGDALGPGARVVLIDVRRGSMTLEHDGAPEELTLQKAAGR